MRDKVMRAVESEGLIVILRGIEDEKLIPLAEAMYEGGVRLIEVTYSADGRVSDERTRDNIRRLAEHFGERMYIGAGTVLTERQVELTYEAGGTFIISPDVCPEVIRKTRELGLVSMPGALTPTEIQTAHKAGADFVKLFPVANMGPGYVKAVRAPLSHIKLLAVGGVSAENARDFMDMGFYGIGVGSNLYNKKLIANGDYEAMTKLAKQFTDAVK